MLPTKTLFFHAGKRSPVYTAMPATAIDGTQKLVRSAFGTALAPLAALAGRPLDDPRVDVRCADVAMYTAKRTQIHFSHYEACADVYSAERLSMLAELSGALRREPTDLDHGDFVLHFQPIMRLGDGTVTGMEALVRWRHPKHGLMLPGSWLPLRACLARWARTGRGLFRSPALSPSKG